MAIKVLLNNEPFFMVDSILLSDRKNFGFCSESEILGFTNGKLCKEEILNLVKFFYYINNIYFNESEPTKISKVTVQDLFNIARTTFYEYLKNDWSVKKIKGYFDTSDIRFLQNKMITYQNLDYTLHTTQEFRYCLIHLQKTKKFFELADKMSNEKYRESR